jgi:hypothetical protein
MSNIKCGCFSQVRKANLSPLSTTGKWDVSDLVIWRSIGQSINTNLFEPHDTHLDDRPTTGNHYGLVRHVMYFWPSRLFMFSHMGKANVCHQLSLWFLAWFIHRNWRWKHRILSKGKLTFNGLHSIISQKTESFITTATRTSNATKTCMTCLDT